MKNESRGRRIWKGMEASILSLSHCLFSTPSPPLLLSSFDMLRLLISPRVSALHGTVCVRACMGGVNRKKNGDETDEDCGGSCIGCAHQQACKLGTSKSADSEQSRN